MSHAHVHMQVHRCKKAGGAVDRQLKVTVGAVLWQPSSASLASHRNGVAHVMCSVSRSRWVTMYAAHRLHWILGNRERRSAGNRPDRLVAQGLNYTVSTRARPSHSIVPGQRRIVHSDRYRSVRIQLTTTGRLILCDQ